MISPQENIHAHSVYRSFIDTAGSGVLEINDSPAPGELLHLAGYLASSLDHNKIDEPGYSC